jgi:hypothetical protein
MNWYTKLAGKLLHLDHLSLDLQAALEATLGGQWVVHSNTLHTPAYWETGSWKFQKKGELSIGGSDIRYRGDRAWINGVVNVLRSEKPQRPEPKPGEFGVMVEDLQSIEFATEPVATYDSANGHPFISMGFELQAAVPGFDAPPMPPLPNELFAALEASMEGEQGKWDVGYPVNYTGNVKLLGNVAGKSPAEVARKAVPLLAGFFKEYEQHRKVS